MRGVKIALIVVGAVAVVVLAGHVAFVRLDEQRSAAFGFATEPAAWTALDRITQVAATKGTLAGSGAGITIPGRELRNVGPTQWTISPDGIIRGTAPERGLVVLFTPEMIEKKVVWKCKVEPEREFLRSTCRDVERMSAYGR